MVEPVRRSVVISAVNIRKGGTLTILQDCLRYLSGRKDLQVTALVHDASLCRFSGIDYIEIPWSTDSWVKRLWCEYFTMHRISRSRPEADLWFSLHDTTPRVRARRQAVYCQTSFPFLKPLLQDWKMDYKIALFSLLTRFAYRIHIRRNRYLVVQQPWMREGLSRLVRFPTGRIIVAPPALATPSVPETGLDTIPLFLYPSTPDCHKNFETVCQAARMLEQRLGKNRFRVVLTVSGEENRYARWLHDQFADVSSIDFHGFMSQDELYRYYGRATCLVFASRVETWGLPISEFFPTGKPMLLPDLPYARCTASGAPAVHFFQVRDARGLSTLMEKVIRKDDRPFSPVPAAAIQPPLARDWEDLFTLLLSSE